MQHRCSECKKPFDFKVPESYLENAGPSIGSRRFSFPPPTRCWSCRRLHRLAFKNERKLYRRKCDKTGKPIVSTYSPDKTFPVYCASELGADNFDATQFGLAWDPNTDPLEAFRTLHEAVPRSSVDLAQCENCDFNNSLSQSRNCYLSFGSTRLEDCGYITSVYIARDSFDSFKSTNLELCYNCFWSRDCYSCRDCDQCTTCRDLISCRFCTGCSDCIGCYGLLNKRYCIFNQQLTSAEYAERKNELRLDRWSASQKLRKEALDFFRSQPTLALVQSSLEDSVGDYLSHGKNVYMGFSSSEGTDCAYLFECSRLTGVVDCESVYTSELAYASVKCTKVYHAAFCTNSSNSSNVFYSTNCDQSKELLLCHGLYRAEYCILNRRYSRNDYEALLPKVIESLMRNSHWGEFLPPSFSEFAFNESEAYYHYPFERDQALRLGFSWKDTSEERVIPQDAITESQLPDSIHDVDDSILKKAIICSRSALPFRLTAPELKFYRKQGIPLPRLHPEERYRQLLLIRNEPVIFKTQCAKCGVDMDTTYPPGSPEILYCSPCVTTYRE